jgi:hypothetical protein
MYYLGLGSHPSGSLIDAMMVMAVLFVQLIQSVAEALKAGFEAATDLIICAAVYFLLALLRSWVPLPPGPFLFLLYNYGIKIRLILTIVGQKA